MTQSGEHRDGLTGLPGREALESLDHGFSSRPEGETWSVMVADVDHFKLINDVYGHLKGDRVLRQVADVLARNVRRTDHVLRYGGDEFVVVMPATSHLQAANQAQRILEDLETEVFPENVRVSLSLGVADSAADDSKLSEVMEKADKALYQAKDGGRGRVSFYRDPGAGPPQAAMSFDHFVDRHRELRSLRATLDEVVEQGSRFALVSGEPGVGKSRLVAELRHYCSFRGCLFLETKCDELGSSAPYVQLTGPIRDHLLESPPAPLREMLLEVGPLHPQTAELLRGVDVAEDDSQEAVSGSEGAVRHRVFCDASSLLRQIARRRPVVFLIDDLQWISGHDLEMLCYLVRTSASARIFFVATMRSPVDGYPEVHRQVIVLSKLVPFLTVELSELPEEYAGHLVMFALRDPHVPRPVLQRLVRQSGGNPFYLRELLKSLTEKGSISPGAAGSWDYEVADDLELPESISQVISERLEGLDDFTRELLRTASAVVGGFTIELLAFVLDEPGIRIARSLQKPLEMELMVEDAGLVGSPEYRFTHDTVRSYLHSQLTLGLRKAVNSRLGLFFEQRLDRGPDELLATVAHYYCDSLDEERARKYSLMAARQAMGRQATREAIRWLECYRGVSFAGSAEHEEDEFFAESTLGDLYTLVADHDRAEECFRRALAMARSPGERGLVLAGLGQMLYNRGDYDQARMELEASLELLPVCETYLRAGMRLAFMWHLRGDSEQATRSFLAMRETFPQIEDATIRKRLEATYCSGAGFVMAHSVSPREGLGLCRKAVDLYRELADRNGEARALLNLAAILSSGGNWEERIGILNRALEVLAEVGDEHSTMVAYVNLGQVYFSLGQLERALDYFDRCMTLVEASGTRRFSVWCWCYRGMIHDQREEYEQSRRCFDSAIEAASGLGLARMLLVSRLNLAAMLMNMRRFGEARDVIGLVEQDTAVVHMGPGLGAALLTLRGMSELFEEDGERDRHTRLRAAESLFRQAMETDPAADATSLVENSYYLACCLVEQGRVEEAGLVLDNADRALSDALSSIRSNIYRDSILETPPVRRFVEMRRRIGGCP